MSSLEELEIQYTPSLFTKRFSSRDELRNHFQHFSLSKSQESRLKYDCHLNISYGPTKREKLDIYGDNLPQDAPLFVFIHGGYWSELDKDCSSFFVKPFIENSIRVIVVEYELCPNVTLEELVKQMQKCFRWIADYVCKNKIKKLSMAGHSAGAHILSFVISESFLKQISPTCAVYAYFLSGVYYLEELRNLKAANENNILLITDENCQRLSPQYHDFSYLKKFNIKVYIYAGKFESEKFNEHSKMFADGPMNAFVTVFKILDVDHFDMIEKLAMEDYEVTRSIIDNLKN